jgi:hypothetical protein
MMNRTRQWPTTPVLTVLFGRSPLSARCSRNCLFRYRRHPDRVRMDQAGAVFGAAPTARHGPADTGGHDTGGRVLNRAGSGVITGGRFP